MPHLRSLAAQLDCACEGALDLHVLHVQTNEACFLSPDPRSLALRQNRSQRPKMVELHLGARPTTRPWPPQPASRAHQAPPVGRASPSSCHLDTHQQPIVGRRSGLRPTLLERDQEAPCVASQRSSSAYDALFKLCAGTNCLMVVQTSSADPGICDSSNCASARSTASRQAANFIASN